MPHQASQEPIDHLALLIVTDEMTVVMTGTGGMIEATIGTDAMIGATTEIVAMTETDETTVATTGIVGMVIVATTEEMIVIVTTNAAVSATAETTMTGEMVVEGRIGEVQKRRRLIGMEKRKEALRKLLLRRA